MLKTLIKGISIIVLILMLLAVTGWIKTSKAGARFKMSQKTFQNVGQFWEEACFLFKNKNKVGRIMKGELISPAFRERLMLVVTAVNNCRMCSAVHTKQALLSGLSRQETESFCR